MAIAQFSARRYASARAYGPGVGIGTMVGSLVGSLVGSFITLPTRFAKGFCGVIGRGVGVGVGYGVYVGMGVNVGYGVCVGVGVSEGNTDANDVFSLSELRNANTRPAANVATTTPMMISNVRPNMLLNLMSIYPQLNTCYVVAFGNVRWASA